MKVTGQDTEVQSTPGTWHAVRAGLSKTTNPNDVPKFIAELVNKAGKEIRKTGLVAR